MEQGKEDVTAVTTKACLSFLCLPGAAAAGHGWDELLIHGSLVLSHLATWQAGGMISPYFTSPEKIEWAVQEPPDRQSPS